MSAIDPEYDFSFYANKFSGQENVVDYKSWGIGTGRRTSGLRLYYLYRYHGIEKIQIFIRGIIDKVKFIEGLI